MGFIEPATIGTIIPHALPPNIKFDIIGIIIQLLNIKGVFLGLSRHDENMFFTNFIGINTFYTTLGGSGSIKIMVSLFLTDWRNISMVGETF